MSAMGARAGATRFAEGIDVESAGLAKASHMTQRRIPIDQSPQRSLDRRPDRLGAGHRAGTGEKFIIDFDEPLGHTRKCIR